MDDLNTDFFQIELSYFDGIEEEYTPKIQSLTTDDYESICCFLYDEIYNECLQLLYKEDFIKQWKNLTEMALDEYTDVLDVEFSLDEYNAILDYVLDVLETTIQDRSNNKHNKHNKHNKQEKSKKSTIKERLAKIDEINETLPPQRTQKWYEMRHNMISASTLWKTLFSDASKKQLIEEKAKPLSQCTTNKCNGFDTPLEWGQRFEPVAQMYYQEKYKTTIKEYGCIPHPDYTFIGASPDGINVDPGSSLYGRMLEIKCIVNREITGIPKKEYWVQMQLQMECCNLDECDFLECRFKTYDNNDEYKKDTTQDRKKGVICCFYDNEHQKFQYEYKPFHITDEDSWIEQTMDQVQQNPNKTWIKQIYWYLDEVSCVYVRRNKDWFNSIFSDIELCWNSVEKKRKEYTIYNKKKDDKIIVQKLDESINTTKSLSKKESFRKQLLREGKSIIVDTSHL